MFSIDDVASFSPFSLTQDFACKVLAYFAVSSGGQATFYSASDDGSRVFIDGSLVVNNYPHSGGISEHSGTFNVETGRTYLYEATYAQGGGAHGWRLSWCPPDSTQGCLETPPEATATTTTTQVQ